MADYEKQKKNECSLEAGQTVEVIDKNSNGRHSTSTLTAAHVRNHHNGAIRCVIVQKGTIILYI